MRGEVRLTRRYSRSLNGLRGVGNVPTIAETGGTSGPAVAGLCRRLLRRR
jgi:hypothetical protein